MMTSKEILEYAKGGKKSAAWTRKAGKNPKGGLNAKGRASYNKETGNKRRSSFCSRMCGMKRSRTSSKTARDPQSRINKSLRAWNCGSCSNWK